MLSIQIKVFNNGPILIEGDFQVVDPEGKAFLFPGRTAIALCRCGHSANKPFCDGAHKTCGLLHAVQARELPLAKPKVCFLRFVTHMRLSQTDTLARV